jgi:hypothetical protein
MWVHEIWPYPVKSMAGETLVSTDLTEQGIGFTSPESRWTDRDGTNPTGVVWVIAARWVPRAIVRETLVSAYIVIWQAMVYCDSLKNSIG